MGTRGPVSKRSDQRRRRNAPTGPQSKGRAFGASAPEPDAEWHPIAMRWYQSLAESGQAEFYEASDWMLAVLMAESISRDLKPQFVGFRQVDRDAQEAEYAEIPMKGASLSAYLKAMTDLLVSEAARRRAGIELMAPKADDDEDAAVAMLDEYRERFAN